MDRINRIRKQIQIKISFILPILSILFEILLIKEKRGKLKNFPRLKFFA